MVDTRNETAGVRTAVADRDDNTHTHTHTIQNVPPSQRVKSKKKTWEEEDSWHKKKRENVVSGDCTPDRKISRISMRSRTMTLQWRQAAVSSFFISTIATRKEEQKNQNKNKNKNTAPDDSIKSTTIPA